MDIYQWNKKYSEISNRYNALYRSTAAHFGFSECQFKILYRLYIEKSAVTQNRLADDFCLSKQTVNSAVMKLVDDGLVSLVKGAEAKNSKLVFLTDMGLEKCRVSIEPLMEAENRALLKISDKRLALFLELFEQHYTVFEGEIKSMTGEKNK